MRVGLTRLVALTAIVVATLGASGQTVFGQAIPKPRPAITETTPPKATAPKPAPAVTETKAAEIDHGSVYLLRGLANIFSLGMNTLAKELEERGVDAVVTNHSHGFEIVDKLAKRYETDKSILPIILIGHSLGGNKTLTMAARLAEKNIPVRLVVIFDATVAVPVPLNVEEVLNLVKPKSVGVLVAGVPGYSGVIKNQEVSGPGIGHISIDKSKKLHDEVIEKVLAVLSEEPAKKPVAKKKPKAKPPEVAAKPPEVTETKPPEVTEPKPPVVTEKPPEVPETKAPEVTEVKPPEATKPPEVAPEAKALVPETPPAAAN
jgi:hypothetical protein